MRKKSGRSTEPTGMPYIEAVRWWGDDLSLIKENESPSTVSGWVHHRGVPIDKVIRYASPWIVRHPELAIPFQAAIAQFFFDKQVGGKKARALARDMPQSEDVSPEVRALVFDIQRVAQALKGANEPLFARLVKQVVETGLRDSHSRAPAQKLLDEFTRQQKAAAARRANRARRRQKP